MVLRSQLALYAYTSTTTSAYPLVVSELGELCEGLEFTTVAPEGFGDLACVVKLPEARIPRPELGLFSRLCLCDGPFTCFQGDIADPALTLDGHEGEYVMVWARASPCVRILMKAAMPTRRRRRSLGRSSANAAGIWRSTRIRGWCCPPRRWRRSARSTMATTWRRSSTICASRWGDHTWEVWDHGRNRDAAGYPTWQLQVHPRDVTTTHYLALAEDVVSWRVQPSEQRAFNVVQVAYTDLMGGPATVTVSDSRLGAGGSQNLASFRRRKLRRNLGARPLTSAQATTIAQAWLAAYQNGVNKVEVELRAVRDVNGALVPLHQVRADRNLFVPQLGVRGQQLPSGAVAGVNQFWIAETVYREAGSGEMALVLQLDSYADHAHKTVGQVKLAQEAATRTRGVYRVVASPGASELGYAGPSFNNVSAGVGIGAAVNFKTVLAKAPTSITLTADGSTNTGGGATAGNIGIYGFNLFWTPGATGQSYWHGTYQTNGN